MGGVSQAPPASVRRYGILAGRLTPQSCSREHDTPRSRDIPKMRRSALAACVVTIGLIACGGDDGSNAGGGAGGAGLTSGTGGGVGGTGGGDGSTRIAVMDEIGEPVAGVQVFVHSADGAVISESASNAEGFVDLPLESGQLVSVAWEAHETWEVQHIDTVPATPGEDLRFTVARTNARTVVNVTFNHNAAFWSSWSCSSNPGTPVQSGNVDVCPGSETFDAIVYVNDSWQIFPEQPSTDGMSFVFDVDPVQLVPAPRIPVTAGSAPAGAILGATLYAYRPGGGYNWTSAQMIGNEVSARRLYAPPGSAIEAHGVLTLTDSQYEQIEWHTALPGDIAIDPIALADVATASHDGAPSTTVTWTLGSGDVGDSVRADLRWAWSDPPSSYKLLWRIYASPEAGAVTVPELPIALTGNPSLGAPEQVTIYHVDVDGADGLTAAANARADRAGQQQLSRLLP